MRLYSVLGLNALQLLNAAAAGSAPNPSSLPNSYGLSRTRCLCSHCVLLLSSFYVSATVEKGAEGIL